MTAIRNRTCTEVRSDDESRVAVPVSMPLSDFRSESAYVLLGDPGLGKSTAFRTEQEAEHNTAVLLDARRFLAIEPGNHQEWREKTLFIDGLDEVRVGAFEARSKLDEIIRRLDALGCPRFRISCRDADWLGDNDRSRLQFVSPTQTITVLRLDPLSDGDIERILNDHPLVSDAQVFIETAQHRGVGDLLSNPQTLNMLADVVGGGERWPQSRRETFGMACNVMAKEQNEEHTLAAQQPPLNELLDAAGYLCTAQLITGSAGFSFDADDTGHLALEEFAATIREIAKAVVSTRLFCSDGERRFEPVHRHVAEFMAARYLAGRIADGFSVSRIVSLISGADGIVVSEMRGLSGWLAALCPQTRDLLIDRDPVGVALYGDLHGFETREKGHLLAVLGERDALVRLRFDARGPKKQTMLAPLIAPDMEPTLDKILSRPSRDTAHQNLVLYVLRLLSQGSPLPGLTPLLLRMARDESRWPYVRSSALDALIRAKAQPEHGPEDLMSLLEQIRVGTVADPNGEMRGALLGFLYPRDIPARLVWDYLVKRSDPHFYGRGTHFWCHELLEKSSAQDVAVLLDELSARKVDVWQVLNSHPADGVPSRLLARGLKARGDNLPLPQLYKWLSAAAPPLWGIPPIEDDSVADVRDWLGHRPKIQQAVVLRGLSCWPKGQWSTESEYAVMAPLHGSSLPAGFGSWCGEQAVRLAPSHQQASEFLLYKAFNAYRHSGTSLELLKAQIAGVNPLEAQLSAWLKQATPAPRSTVSDRKAAREAKHETKRQQGIEYVRGHAIALGKNEAPLSLLHDLGRAYFRYMVSPAKPQEPIDRISDLLGGDDELVQAALAGLRGSLWRSELPSPKEIIRLNEASRQHFLAYPVQAGLDLLQKESPERLQELSEGQVASALAFYHCTPGSFLRSPIWHEAWAAVRPELVAAVATDVAIAALRGDGGYWTAVNALADMGGRPDLKHEALLEVLSKFPLRARLETLRTLDFLIWNALDYPERTGLLQLIDSKLANTSMSVAQRVHWLAAGVVAAPEPYIERLSAYVQAGERRARYLTDFFDARDPLESNEREFSASVLRVLIELMGPAFAPDSLYESGTYTLEMKASRQIERFIQQLSALPDEDATQALASLVAEHSLSKWSDYIERARDDQRVLYREATYSHIDLKQLLHVLDDGEPANASDLAALVIDRLGSIALEIRSSNAELWRQYWNEDRFGQPQTPKHEDSCRDALLAHLRRLLPRNVDAQPEGQYVGDKRSDIRVSYADFSIPVEIKKVTHRDLWSAMSTQLIGKYTRDPNTSGYGIYLVLWFAGVAMQPPPKGTRPTTPGELQARLKRTLAHDESRRIEVVVIDMSQPP